VPEHSSKAAKPVASLGEDVSDVIVKDTKKKGKERTRKELTPTTPSAALSAQTPSGSKATLPLTPVTSEKVIEKLPQVRYLNKAGDYSGKNCFFVFDLPFCIPGTVFWKTEKSLFAAKAAEDGSYVLGEDKKIQWVIVPRDVHQLFHEAVDDDQVRAKFDNFAYLIR